MKSDDPDDDDDPALEQFLGQCRRFMAECPSLWLDLNDANPPAAPEPAPVTTDALVAEAHANRAGQDYPTANQTIANLPVVLQALCDHLLDVHPEAMDVARRLASIIDAVEHVRDGPLRNAGHANALH